MHAPATVSSWSETTILSILSNPHILGICVHGHGAKLNYMIDHLRPSHKQAHNMVMFVDG
jgi:hypothetical protein